MQDGIDPEHGPKHLHSPGISTRSEEQIDGAHTDQLAKANLLGLAAVEAWTVNGTNRQNAYSTHGIFRYFGKYPPPIGERLIREHTGTGDLVVDPMCGSGTTGVEALLLRRKCKQLDVSPLGVLVSRAKATRVPLAESEPLLDRVLEEASPKTVDEDDFMPVGLRRPEHWFLDETMDSLRGLHAAIRALPAGRGTNLLWAAFAATIRRVSRATTQQGRLFLDADTALPDARPTFRKSAQRALVAVAGLPESGACDVVLADSRLGVPEDLEGKAQLVILHPPYFNSYRYSRVNSLELAWLGHDVRPVRKGEVREFFKVGDPANVEHYVSDLVKVVCNAARTLVSGGRLGLMIGDTVLRGAHVPTTRMILDRLPSEIGLELAQVAIRVPRHTEATWVASQRRTAGKLGVALCDYVLQFQKT